MAKHVDNSGGMSPTVNRTAESQQLMVEVVNAATRLFGEKGFLGTTTQEIADSVGLLKGTLYYHIGSKDDLLYRIHDEVTGRGIDQWTEIVDASADLPAPEVLRRLIIAHCLLIDEFRDAVAVFSEEMKHLPADLRDKIRAKRGVYQGIFENAVRRGVERGELRTDDAHLTALVGLGMMNAMYRWYTPGGRLTPQRIGEIMTSIVLDGIRPTQPAGYGEAEVRPAAVRPGSRRGSNRSGSQRAAPHSASRRAGTTGRSR